MKGLLLLLVVVVVVAIGVAGVVAGESDDSPGLQGLGALLVIAAATFGIRTLRRQR